MRGACIQLMVVSALLAVCTGAHGQVVTGRVIDAASDMPLAAVQVALLAADGRTVARAMTDSAGTFELHAPRFGSFTIIAVLNGMITVSTDPFDVQHGAMNVLVRMAATVVPLEPLTVEARGARAELGFLTGYYERMHWNQRTGVGRFITRDAIDARNPLDMSDMLREIPRVGVARLRGTGNFVTMRGARGECTPALYIDGVRANRRDRAHLDELVRPGDVEGVEIYVGLAQLPGQYHDETGCGVLLVWTRRGTAEGRPFSWRRAAIAAGFLVGFILLLR
jgi:hypothetical protein